MLQCETTLKKKAATSRRTPKAHYAAFCRSSHSGGTNASVAASITSAKSTIPLTNATLPYLVEVARHGPDEATHRDADLAHGLNTVGGEVVNPVVAAALADVTPA